MMVSFSKFLWMMKGFGEMDVEDWSKLFIKSRIRKE